jgi:pimeloyl-ACP methyl ester carboxylesterase
MAMTRVGGIDTRYEVLGSGPPLLMFSPGGFDATVEKWSAQSVYAKSKMLEALVQHHTCIVFDRRETGQSGGRVQSVTWADYAAQGRGLLDHLGIERAFVMGGCMGCAPAVSLAVSDPQRVRALLLYWPVGGAKYRLNGQARFMQHLAYVQQHGMAEVVTLARSGTKSFGEDPRGGPWVSVLRRDEVFAAAFAAMDVERYRLVVTGMMRALMDRDTAPGAEPEAMLQLDIPALVVPGRDASHATSAARYLEECLPRAEYWDAPPEAQTADSVGPRLIDFLARCP